MATYRKTFSSLGQYTLRLVATEASTSQTNNTSRVNVKMYIDKRSGTGYWLNDPFTAYIEINGSRQNYTINGYDFRGRTTLKLAERTVTVAHNRDGSKNCSIRGHVNAAKGSGTIGTATASGTLGLKKFNRKGYIRELSSVFNLHGNNGFRLNTRSNGLNYKVRLQRGDGSRTYQTWTVSPGWNNIAVSSSTRNNIYNDFSGTGYYSLRLRLHSYVGSNQIGVTSYGTKAKPQGVSFSAPSSITLGNTANITFTKQHTSARFEFGLCYRGGGSWLPGYPKSFSGVNGTLETNTDAVQRAILSASSNGSYANIGIWAKQMNSKGSNLGTREVNLRVNIPKLGMTFSATPYFTRLTVRANLTGLMTAINSLQYSLNGGAWQGAPHTTFDITGLSPGKSYSLRLRVRQSGSSVWVTTSTQTYRTLSSPSLSLSGSSGLVGSSFTASVSAPSGVTSRLRVENEEGKVINGPRTVSSGSHRLSFGYSSLKKPRVNDTSYKSPVTVICEFSDGKGTTYTHSRKFEYRGHSLPYSGVHPQRATSEGVIEIIYSQVGSFIMKHKVSIKDTGKVLTQGSGTKSVKYRFNPEDFEDLFKGNEWVEVLVNVEGHIDGFLRYSSDIIVKVKSNAELFIRVNGEWVNRDEIYVFIGEDAEVVAPSSRTVPGFKTNPSLEGLGLRNPNRIFFPNNGAYPDSGGSKYPGIDKGQNTVYPKEDKFYPGMGYYPRQVFSAVPIKADNLFVYDSKWTKVF